MKIGILGVGHIGKTLTIKLSKGGHNVKVAHSGAPDTIESDVVASGARAVWATEAVNDVDVVIISIPLKSIPEIAPLIRGLPSETIVIDTSNYYPHRDGRIEDIEAGEVESLWVSKQLGRPVIKAFNNILAYSLAELGRPEGSPGRLAVAVAGEDDTSKRVAMNLVNEVGFDPVDAGSLEDSWRQQPSTPAYCCDYDADTMRKALAAAVKGDAAKKRDQLSDRWATALGSSPSHADIVALIRSLSLLA
jgi:8-hydroxy-5-deazaflavin:NADPH oxidoreductase